MYYRYKHIYIGTRKRYTILIINIGISIDARDEYYSPVNWFRNENRNSLYNIIISAAAGDFNALYACYT